MTITIYGTIFEVLPEVTGTGSSGNNWRTRTFAIRTGGQYPETIAFTLRGTKIDEASHLLVPQTAVGVTFYHSSRRWPQDMSSPGKYFTDLIVTLVVPAPAQQQAVPQSPAPQPTAPQGYPTTANAQPQAPQQQYAQPAPSDTLPF